MDIYNITWGGFFIILALIGALGLAGWLMGYWED